MKLLIPVESASLDAPVCPSFGRAPFFALFDPQNGEHEFRSNPAAQNPGGAGIAAAQLAADSGADTLITFRCGQNAADVLSAARISMLAAQSGSARENIAAFEAGKLAPLTKVHPGFHGHGGEKT